MLLNYMIAWTTLMMFFMGLIKLRSLIQCCVMGLLSTSTLVLTWILVNELLPEGMDIAMVNPLAHPDAYINAGMSGWLILIILPCGWLAPFLGANAAEKWGRPNYGEVEIQKN